ncbi:hypothetical protein GHT06_008775 [Daphnia sinensis]|uniref:Uncharacterized protein n=1 Tax=Daphnia sinensis TaxID=1820382 RepID=A0AAD5LLQ6_9CRUS|nr:hypothetical protein GHT06_008775 [Daphnia sinensis]
MANDAFPLEAIQEEEPKEELEEWQRTNAKRIHTMALNYALLAVRMQKILVLAYGIVERIHRRHVVCKFDAEDLDRETRWGFDISIKHSRRN